MEAYGLLILLSFGAVCIAVLLLAIAAFQQAFGHRNADVAIHQRWRLWLSVAATTISLAVFFGLALGMFVSPPWLVRFGTGLAIGSFLLAAGGVLLAWRASGPGRVSSGIAAAWMMLVWAPVMIVILNAR